MKKMSCPFKNSTCDEKCAIFDNTLNICAILGQHISNVLIGERIFDIINMIIKKIAKENKDEYN